MRRLFALEGLEGPASALSSNEGIGAGRRRDSRGGGSLDDEAEVGFEEVPTFDGIAVVSGSLVADDDAIAGEAMPEGTSFEGATSKDLLGGGRGPGGRGYGRELNTDSISG